MSGKSALCPAPILGVLCPATETACGRVPRLRTRSTAGPIGTVEGTIVADESVTVIVIGCVAAVADPADTIARPAHANANAVRRSGADASAAAPILDNHRRSVTAVARSAHALRSGANGRSRLPCHEADDAIPLYNWHCVLGEDACQARMTETGFSSSTTTR